ncbi:MAG: hypothetical protein NZ891_08415, partial [bacterium]|nr:hypothetical protein [bacterium]MDW8164744.1 hypothetical protein [Candidatus Omnitrophota bacterium]
ILLKYNCPNLPLIENLFPNKIKNKSINELQYKKEGFEKINKLMTDSFKVLNKSIINKVRMDLNEPVANFLYVYGMGKLKEKIDVYEKIKKRVLFYSNSEILEGLRIFFNIEKVHKIPEIEEGILYWFNFSLNLNDSPSIWVKNFEIFAKDVLEKIQYREDTRFLFIFDPFMNENYEYEKSLSIFLAVNFSKKIKKKYKNSAFLFKNFID